MAKCSFSDMNCPIAKALDVIGEWWTMLIIRDLMIFGGQRGFEDLRESLGISRNILTGRLKRLYEEGLVDKVPQVEGGKRMRYQITERGWDLMPILIGMKQWGDKWCKDDEDLVEFVDVRDKLPLAPVQLHAADGRPLDYTDILPQGTSPEVQDYLNEHLPKECG